MKKKGFTLVELLAIVIVISILMMIVVPSIFNISQNSKNNSYKVLMETIENSGNLFLSSHRNEITDAISTDGSYYLTIADLVEEGLLKTPVVDPRTNDEISSNKKVYITMDYNKLLTVCYEDDDDCQTLLTNKFNSAKAQGEMTTKNGSDYYIGADPDNWVEFGQVSSGDTTPLLWRIVKADSEGVKIIYEGVKNGGNAPTANGRIQIGGTYNVAWDTSNANKWERPATIKAQLATWYSSLYVTNKTSYESPINWCIGASGQGINYSTVQITTAQFQSTECVNGSYTGGSFLGKTTSTSAVGFLRVSDYLNASSDSRCTGSYTAAGGGTYCGTSGSSVSTNYLWKSAYWYWTLNSDALTSTTVWIVHTPGYAYDTTASNASGSVRPVVNLKSNILYISGNGSLNNPYKLRGTGVIPADTTPPVITLVGTSPKRHNVNTPYTDAGATATDNKDGDIKSSIKITNNVNSNVKGTYTVTYTVKDKAGNAATPVTRIVIVADPDPTPPVITRLGTSPVSVTLGSSYSDAGATASDNIDGDITSQIQVTNPVNVNSVGTYTVTYNVSDSSGNAATSVTRTVNVVAPIYNFAYNGTSQSWTVPATGTYKLEVWGASGGDRIDYDGSTDYYGGRGGYAAGNMSLTSGQVVYIYVGGQGSGYSGTNAYAVRPGGFNGGGAANGASTSHGSGGGGGTDMRIGGTALGNRVIVAGGGGGIENCWGPNGAYGGGTTGGSTSYAGGGTQSSGGQCLQNPGNAYPGTLGQGGDGASTCASGGGGGYYGGAGAYGGSSGGGSSYTGSLSSAQNVAGNASMPAPGGGNETGHAGHGYARITRQ